MKTRVLSIFLILLLCLTAGCGKASQNTEKPDGFSFSESQTEEAAGKDTSQAEQTAPAQPPEAQSAQTADEETEGSAESERRPVPEHPVSGTTPPQTSDPQQKKDESERRSETTASPAPSETEQPIPPATEEPKPSEPPQPTQPSTEPPTEPSFDIGYWVNFAKSYAESVGLTLDSGAAYCWDNPIAAGSKCRYTERDIKGYLDRYAITVSHKTVEEMADQYGFNEEQREYLAELLEDKNNSLWAAVLYGIHYSDDQIVTVALSQVGNVGGEPYWSWYGFGSRVEWCACFVSWCANECGYIETGVIPKFAGCVNGVQWFKDRGQWIDGSAEPVSGMIIFFDWDNKGSSGPQDGQSDHVGIVQKVENGIVYTVEGNSGDSCRVNQYSVGHYEVLGYGVPQY